MSSAVLTLPASRRPAGTSAGRSAGRRGAGPGLSLAVAGFGALVAHRETFLQGMQVSLVIAALLLLATAAASLSLRIGTSAQETDR